MCLVNVKLGKLLEPVQTRLFSKFYLMNLTFFQYHEYLSLVLLPEAIKLVCEKWKIEVIVNNNLVTLFVDLDLKSILTPEQKTKTILDHKPVL